ncbi:CocE/NonD family hydrolase [Neobacillus novalis]|uniref:Xaa-Pro dipeptidyl-peptidase n=1 Tax=Neobacillus novalis TaxID=220687 RepID=A0AA95SD69_9BACI|nr:CocE/NonD family hydrolase [Neobacillus novalis]WHY86803.1 CocE/NonD family hydrolase [Neobacillus novalis]
MRKRIWKKFAPAAMTLSMMLALVPSTGFAAETPVPLVESNSKSTSYDYKETVDSLTALVDRLSREGEIPDSSAARVLKTHLQALSLYVKQGAKDKVEKHKESFKQLLEAQKTAGMITAGAYTYLKNLTNYAIMDGVTQEQYSYADAIRETVYIDTDLDTDGNGVKDHVAIDIIRPAETANGLQVPVIMVASPYYDNLGRGNESQLKKYVNGVPVSFPLFFDNYFVPRGYAVVEVDMIGTNNSDGCTTTGGYEETASVTAAIDWLNGRASGKDINGKKITADWSTGKVGMYGKSYDGTLANAAASTGIDGLETIVPVGAISSWYNYYRQNGVTFNSNGPDGLSNTVGKASRRNICAPVRQRLATLKDDPSGNYNDFWEERDYVKNVDKVKASVFLIHGLNDQNVKTSNIGEWWAGLEKNNVPRKIWLQQTGHTEPFDTRREEWVKTIHRWFDYWLLKVENGIMDEPMADLEVAPKKWKTASTWPEKDASFTTLKFGPAEGNGPNTLTGGNVGEGLTVNINNVVRTEAQNVANPTTKLDGRVVFLSDGLKEDLRFSGTPVFDIQAKFTGPTANLTAYIVDYGRDERVNYASGEGIKTLTSSPKDCIGQSTASDSACYYRVDTLTTTADYAVVSRGYMDARNYDSFRVKSPLEIGKSYNIKWDGFTHDFTFKKGHRIGVVLASSTSSVVLANRTAVQIEVTLGSSGVKLPIVGGIAAVGF